MVERISERTGLPAKETRVLIDAIFDPDPAVGLIAAELVSGRKVAISGFGTFESRPRKARIGRNPHTGEALDIPATRAPTFKAGKPLKETLRSA
ncbi:MAG: HU family DNA-binding protein [bacterium]|nr:HU family DNA-binding protein [bacterium]